MRNCSTPRVIGRRLHAQNRKRNVTLAAKAAGYDLSKYEWHKYDQTKALLLQASELNNGLARTGSTHPTHPHSLHCFRRPTRLTSCPTFSCCACWVHCPQLLELICHGPHQPLLDCCLLQQLPLLHHLLLLLLLQLHCCWAPGQPLLLTACAPCLLAAPPCNSQQAV